MSKRIWLGLFFFFLSLSLFHFVFKTNVDELIGRLIATLKEFETNLAVVMGDPKFWIQDLPRHSFTASVWIYLKRKTTRIVCMFALPIHHKLQWDSRKKRGFGNWRLWIGVCLPSFGVWIGSDWINTEVNLSWPGLTSQFGWNRRRLRRERYLGMPYTARYKTSWCVYTGI